ncbi:uncharacterized protein LOC130613546 [Hydractinia symbiolongicarpus]|uniref:uncharacterized protein LOC130613546 n=1 Tax=Hydractinia symbiolongicarpus TaxID=13093 RepID=UPI002549E5E3|nr:uncharacterized protein LOC130613546 [Hydractinia symbiolongicarpus]
MDYDLISKMSVEELKNYLRVRNLRISGRKEELIARVFSAAENFVQPVKTAQEVESNLKEEYQKKLKINDRTLPDPFKIPHGWMDEQEGIKFWPMVLYPDIFSYLMFYPSELGCSDLNDYKNSKAYSYYKSGWLQPLAYHDLSGSNFCIFKGTCRKSQAINDPFHKLWLILEKSGKIMSCHCTCMAGMSQTCNHVAAALYRIEAAVRIGLTNTACTSTANEWLPNRKQVAPTKIKDLNFSRDNFSDRGKRKRPLVSTPKKNFDPLQHCGEKLLSLNEIADELKEIIPESILFTAVPKPEIDFVKECLSISDVTQPSDIYSISDILAMSKTKTEFECNLVAIYM